MTNDKAYVESEPINCETKVDTSSLKGKTAVITGGASGIGESYVRALVKAGAFVAFGDVDEARGSKLASELSKSAEFVKCDVTNWEDQLALFKKAKSASPNNRIDIVIPNAGITGPDPLFSMDDDLEDPKKPEFKIVNINIVGVAYTVKLALHHFSKQYKANKSSGADNCLILQGSLAGYLGLPEAVQYNMAKYAIRGILNNLRLTAWQLGTRVNNIAPWFIETGILPAAAFEMLKGAGVPLATLEDCTQLMLKIASDPSIHGRSLAVVPRVWAPSGYFDLNLDSYKDPVMKQMNDIATAPAAGQAETMEK